MNPIETIVNNYINLLILPSEPLHPLWNRENLIFGKSPKWNYMDACMIRALLERYDITGQDELLSYARRFVSTYVSDDGSIPTVCAEDYNLDNICGAQNLIELHRLTGSEKFRLGYEKLWSEQLQNQPRLGCGNFWHKAIYPRQLWLDGAYMALPFLCTLGKLRNDQQLIDDALSQLANIRDIMRDGSTGLYYHGYDESRTMYWADPDTGLSGQFWLRSMGWLCAGLADIYEMTLSSSAGEMLSGLLEALERCTTDEGMLLQLPVRPELAANYPETSGTLLFAYSAMKSHRLGVVGSDIRNAGERALSAVAEHFISLDNSGLPVLRNICLMGGLGGELRRDGSAEYYLSEPVVENDAKGIAPFIMASTELFRQA